MIFLILLLGLLLRLISLNQSLWLDEATSAIVVRDLTLTEIITKFSLGDFHPPVYYFLLKIWSFIFGTRELGLRSLSVAAGLGSIFVLYYLTNRLFNKTVALVSAALLATSGLHLYFSQEARMYVLASFFVLVSIFFFVKTLNSDRVGNFVGFAIFLTLSGFTHYMTLFMIPVYVLFGFVEKFKFSWWKKFLASHIILVIAWIPWMSVFIDQLKVGYGVKLSSPVWWDILGKSGLKEIILVPVKFMIGRISFENNLIYGLVVLSSGSLFAYLLIKSTQLRQGSAGRVRNLSLVWLWLFVPSCLGILLGLKISIFSYFRFLFLLPAFYLLIAVGIAEHKKKLQTILVVTVWL